MGRHIIEILENTIKKGVFFLEEKLDSSGKMKKVNKAKKQMKKLLEQEVDYLHEDFSKSEKKAIVSMYYKHGITPPADAEKKKQFITELEFKQRMKELEEIQQEQTKELSK